MLPDMRCCKYIQKKYTETVCMYKNRVDKSTGHILFGNPLIDLSRRSTKRKPGSNKTFASRSPIWDGHNLLYG